MSLFSKKPKSIADFEKEIEKLRQKKKLSTRNSERLEEYEKQLSSLKTAEEAEQKKKVRQKKIAIGSIAASVALVACIIIAGCISESGTVESPAVSPGYTISDSSTGTTTPLIIPLKNRWRRRKTTPLCCVILTCYSVSSFKYSRNTFRFRAY